MTRTVIVLRVGVAVVLLALLWQLADGRAVLDRLATSDPRWLVAALLATNLQTVLSALRWRLTAGRLGLPLTLGHAVGDYYLGNLVNQTLPGGMLGDAARAVRSRQEGLLVPAQAVVIERMAGQAALFLVMLAGLLLALVLPQGPAMPEQAVRVPLILLAGVAVLALGATVAMWLWPGVAARFGRGFWQAIRVSVLSRAVWPQQAALGLAIVACNLLTFDFCARATGSALPLLAVVTLVPLVVTAMLVPLSISGWGLREGAAAGLLPLAGIAPEAAIAASLAFGGVLIAGALPGAGVLAATRRRIATPRERTKL